MSSCENSTEKMENKLAKQIDVQPIKRRLGLTSLGYSEPDHVKKALLSMKSNALSQEDTLAIRYWYSSQVMPRLSYYTPDELLVKVTVSKLWGSIESDLGVEVENRLAHDPSGEYTELRAMLAKIAKRFPSMTILDIHTAFSAYIGLLLPGEDTALRPRKLNFAFVVRILVKANELARTKLKARAKAMLPQEAEVSETIYRVLLFNFEWLYACVRLYASYKEEGTVDPSFSMMLPSAYLVFKDAGYPLPKDQHERIMMQVKASILTKAELESGESVPDHKASMFVRKCRYHACKHVLNQMVEHEITPEDLCIKLGICYRSFQSYFEYLEWGGAKMVHTKHHPPLVPLEEAMAECPPEDRSKSWYELYKLSGGTEPMTSDLRKRLAHSTLIKSYG